MAEPLRFSPAVQRPTEKSQSESVRVSIESAGKRPSVKGIGGLLRRARDVIPAVRQTVTAFKDTAKATIVIPHAVAEVALFQLNMGKGGSGKGGGDSKEILARHKELTGRVANALEAKGASPQEVAKALEDLNFEAGTVLGYDPDWLNGA